MADWWAADPTATPVDVALSAEGADPQFAALAQGVYQQESGGGKNTKTSNAGAHGGMQIIPTTFHSVADKGWDINDPVDNARAGVRYLKQMYDKAGGDPALAAAGYYGGPGAIDKARQGVAVSDPRNPNAPNTLQYGAQVAARAAAAQPANAPQAASAPQQADGGNWWSSDPVASPQDSSQAAQAPQQDEQPGFFSRVAKGIGDLGDRYMTDPLGTTVDMAHGAVDGLTFGLGDKVLAAGKASVNGTTYDDELVKQHQANEAAGPAFTAGQLASAFIPGAGELSLVNRAVEAVPTASRAARVMAGGAAGMTEGAAQVYGHADADNPVTGGQLAMGMGLGAVGGGLGGAMTKATDNQLANSFLNKSGTIEAGQRDAQIISDLKAMDSRATQGGAKLGAADGNALARSYTQDAAAQLRQMPKTQDRQTLLDALNRARGLDDTEIAALRQLPNGDAVADAIQMHQRTLTLTAPTPANLGKVASAARMLVDNGALHAVSHVVPGGSLLTLAPVRHYVMGALLGGRANRTANIESALQQGPMAQAFLKRFGQGTANQSAQGLAQAAQAAQAARAAAPTAGQDARGWKQGDSAFQRAQAAAQQARQQAQAANPMTPEAQAAARDYMFRAQQAGQANRAGMAQQAQAAGQAEASVGPQMNAVQAKAAQAMAAQQAQQAAARMGPQITPAQRAALQAQQAADTAKSQASLKVQLAQKQALADQVMSDPTNVLGMSNEFGPPRNADQMSEFSKVMKDQAEAAAIGPQAPASPALAAAQKAQAKQAVAQPGTVAVWRNADTDIPVTVKGIEPQPGPDGRTYVRVEHNGQETFVPHDELQPASKSAQAHVKAQNLSRTVSNIAQGNYEGLTFQSPASRMMLAHLGNSDPAVVKAAISKLAAEHPATHGKVAAQMLSSSPAKFNYLPLQDALTSMDHIGARFPSQAEKDALMGRAAAPTAAPAGTSPIAAATGDIQNVPAWNSAKESRQIIQNQALASAQDPAVKKLVAELIDTKNVKGSKDPAVNRQKAFDDFMKSASTDQQIEAKRVAETLIRYGK